MRKGQRCSEELRQKLSNANRGKHHSLETRQKMSQSHKGLPSNMLGKKQSLEARQKMSESRMGEKNHFFGKKHSDITKHKISIANHGKRRSLEARRRTSEALVGRIFSLEHRRKKSNAQKGEKNHQWRGGIGNKNHLIRKSLEYRIWAMEVYKKDQWTCRLCRKICGRGNIIAHHLKLFSEFPELRFCIDNGITLCRSCHMKIHSWKINGRST